MSAVKSKPEMKACMVAGAFCAAFVAAGNLPHAEAAFPYETSFEEPTWEVGDFISDRADGEDGTGPDGWRSTTSFGGEDRRVVVEGGVNGVPATLHGSQALMIGGGTATLSAYYTFASEAAPITEPFTVEVVMARFGGEHGGIEMQINGDDRGDSFDGVRFGFDENGFARHRSNKSSTPFTDLTFGDDPVAVDTWVRWVIDVDPANASYDLAIYDEASGDLIGQGSNLPSRGGEDEFVSFRVINSSTQPVGQYIDSISIVPEPASLGLLAIGGLTLLGRRRRH